MLRSDSLSSDLAQSLSSIKNKPKKRKLKKKKKLMVITATNSNQSQDMIEASSDDEHDYDDSDFLQDESAQNSFKFEFFTPSEMIKEKRQIEPFFTDTAFDELFENKGIHAGDIIEICGRHQIGKTTIVTSLAVDILIKYPEAHIAIIDTKNDIQTSVLHRMLMLRGYDEETVLKKFFNRILLFGASNIFEFLDTLKTIVKGESDYEKVSFIFIDSITCPFYHASGNIRLNMKMTSEIHQVMFELAKEMHKVIILTNLQLNMYKISESDESACDSGSSTTSSSSDEENDNGMDNLAISIKPALGNYWSEILDVRILVSMDAVRESDVLGFIEIKRKLTVLESKNFSPLNSVLVNITDMGVI